MVQGMEGRTSGEYFAFSYEVLTDHLNRGTQSSHLYYQPGEGDSSDGRTGQWIIISLRDENFELRLSPKDSRDYPFGSYNWQLGIPRIIHNPISS